MEYEIMSNTSLLEEVSEFIITFIVASWIMIAIFGLIIIISLWKVFEKAGKPGYAAIIPIYNAYTLYEISGLKGWYIFLYLIPIVGVFLAIYFSIKSSLNLAKAFNKTVGFGIGLILLNVIFLPILAFGNDTYDNSVFDETTR